MNGELLVLDTRNVIFMMKLQCNEISGVEQQRDVMPVILILHGKICPGNQILGFLLVNLALCLKLLSLAVSYNTERICEIEPVDYLI